MVTKFNKARNDEIAIYAENWHSPISDFKNFNAYVKRATGKRTTRKKVARLLNYL